MRVPLKRQESQSDKPQKRFVVADIETREWVHYVVGGIYDGKRISIHKNPKSLIDHLLDHYSGIDCYAHFGGRFDFLFFLREILKHEDEYQLGPIIPRGSGILCFDLERGASRITFRDSSALLPFSLKRLTESFGVDHIKKDYDHSKTKGITKELLKYLSYDLKGLYEVIERFYHWPLIREAGGATTLASQAIRVWRTRLPVDEISSLSKSLDAALRPGYQGGRVEIFKPLYRDSRGKKPLYLYDINSLYPYCMRTFDFPTEFKYETTDYQRGELGIYQCEVDMPKMYVPPLGTTQSGKFIFPVGHFSGMYTSAEIEYAKTFGARFKISRGWIFENGGPIFRDFVDELYAIRMNSKPDSVDSTIAKLLLNSCYGRTGIRPEKENIVLDDGSLGLRPLKELKVGTKTYRLMLKETEIETFSHVAIAAFVTAYGRITTHRRIMEAPQEIYYTDTDSLFTTHAYRSGTGLGELKLEYSCDSACFLLPKTYIAGEKTRMKGFDRKKINAFTQDDFEACLEGDLKRLKIVQEPRFATMRTAMQQGVLVTMTKASHKQIRSKYDKRDLIQTESGWDTQALKFGGGSSGPRLESPKNILRTKERKNHVKKGRSVVCKKGKGQAKPRLHQAQRGSVDHLQA